MITHFPNNRGYCFPYWVVVNFKFSLKKEKKKEILRNWKVKISKNSTSSFERTIEKRIQEKFENFWLRFVGSGDTIIQS